MTSPPKHFLLIYDAPQSKLLSIEEFKDEAQAVEVFTKTEREYFGNRQIRIVLLAGHSKETIEQTHGNFFRKAAEVA